LLPAKIHKILRDIRDLENAAYKWNWAGRNTQGHALHI
jgi:hypothetical protein